MECKKTSGQIVLPVLYKVKPFEVRELEGAFGKAFKEKKRPFKEEDVKLKGLEALREVVDCRIFESEKFASGREAELVNELVEIITRMMQHDFQPPLPGELVGFDDHLANVMRLADTASSEIQTIVIYGIGGIGKAIARPANKKPWDCSRLWDEEAITVQRSKDENRNIEALRLDKNGGYINENWEGWNSMKMESASLRHREASHLEMSQFENFLNLPQFEILLELELLQWYELKELDGLEALESLRNLNVSISTELSNLNDFEDLESLRHSDMQSRDEKVDDLGNLRGVDQLKSLEVLNISALMHIKRLNLSNSKDLKQLIVNNCQNLVEIHFHDKIESLERFDRDGCQPQITRLFSM
ncbi:hypothetical protein NL676_036555 [Syzygium grande]|nr:hypothetical protein NL676_036555 [Syzygium grande]